jgi:hypothetical protein
MVFLDFDNCAKNRKITNPDVQAVVDALPGAYLEFSHSGTGIHLVFCADANALARLRTGPGSRHAQFMRCRMQVFIGGDASFIAMTGDVLRGDPDWDGTDIIKRFVSIGQSSERVKTSDVDIDDLSAKEAAALDAKLTVEVAQHVDGLADYPEKPDGTVDRSDADMRLAHLCKAAGLTSREYAHLVRSMADDLSQRDDRQIQRCWAKAERRAKEIAFDSVDSGLTDLVEFAMSDRPPPRYLVHRMIPEGEVSIIAGEPGAVKTTLACGLALHVATGQGFGPLPVEKSRVLYIAAEGQRGVADRVEALITHLGLSPAPRALLTAQGWDGFSIADKEQLRKLRQAVKAEYDGEKIWIIIDTLISAVRGRVSLKDEDGLGAVIMDLIELARDLNATITVLHHTVKGAWKSAKGRPGASSVYGSGIGQAPVRAILSVTKDGEVTVEKMNDGPEGPLLRLERETVAIRGGTTLVVLPADPTDGALLRALKQADGEWVEFPTLLEEYMLALRPEDTAGEKKTDARKRHTNNALRQLNTLVTNGQVEKDERKASRSKPTRYRYVEEGEEAD